MFKRFKREYKSDGAAQIEYENAETQLQNLKSETDQIDFLVRLSEIVGKDLENLHLRNGFGERIEKSMELRNRNND